MLDQMETIKTYPAEVQALREQHLAEIAAIRAKYEATELERPATDTRILERQSLRPQDQLRAYHAEVEPYVQALVRLEGFAILSVVVQAA